MISDGRAIPRDTVLDADICIVGGGAAGITLARSVERLGARICLIESGGLAFDADTNALYKAENIGLPYWALDECQIRALGGSTNGWGGWCRPLDPHDFMARPWIADSGWPIAYADLEPHYAAASRLCQLPSPSYAIEERLNDLSIPPDVIIPSDFNTLSTVLYQFSPPTRFGDAFRQDLEQSAGIQCVLYANVMEVRASENGRVAEEVRVGCLNGARFRVRAKTFILAAGGIENARLLLLSRRPNDVGLGNDHDLVGRYFMEHPYVERRIIGAGPKPSLALYGLTYRKQSISARLSLSEAAQARERILAYSANIRPLYPGANSEGFRALNRIVNTLNPALRRDPFLRVHPYGKKRVRLSDIGAVARELPQTLTGGVLRGAHAHRFVRNFVLESKSEQAPNRDSRVVLGRDRDALGLNRVKLDWRLLDIDRYSVVRGEEILDEELQRLGIGRLEPLEDHARQQWPGGGPGGGWHQLGTTRMHADPKKGVVDRNCRVHGVGNLYIAGGSVFPTVGSAPPTLTIIALAMRLADHIGALHKEGRLAA